ncbi:pitrilysin family protein [Malonomonas rubra]|uniref:M16 family metallopeptidase n=1 Tax=Malonomonas rubra TaxID=57040 RepID=UPI0026EE1EF4|nr:pitrilysin family protein [Malonomonas rubra]
MIRLIFCCLLFLLFGCDQTVKTAQVRPDQLQFPKLEFTFPEVSKQQLANGMKLYMKEDHELPLVDITMMIDGGSIEDSLAQTGLSQFFAAALETGGTESLSPIELESELEDMAAELSVESDSYNLSIHLSIHQQDLRRGLEILADMLRRPRFDAERVELARKQLLEVIHRQNDDPGMVAERILSEAVFPQHPLGSTAKAAAVEAFSREDLLKKQQRCLQPNNIWIAVSGAVEQRQMIDLLNDNFADWQPVVQITAPLPPLPPTPEGRVWMVSKDIPQTSIMIGHPGINKDNPDLFALQIANFILGGGGFNSRMMREIRSNRGLAYSVYSYFKVGRRLPELFIAAAETKCATTGEVVSLMQQLMQQLRDEPVSAEELELAKQSLINSFVFAFNDTHSIVTRKVRLDFFSYPEGYLENYRDRIAAVTIADVQRVARKYLHSDQLQIVLVGDLNLFVSDVDDFGLPVEQVEL